MPNPPNLSISASPPELLTLRVRLVLLGTAFLFCCSPALDALVHSWSDQDEYGFRVLAPLLAALWIWYDRAALRAMPVRPALQAGAALLAAAALVLFFGRLAPSALLQELALCAVPSALVLLLLGWSFLKRLSLPLAFLALMAPVLDPLIARLHWPFQLFAAAVSEQLLALLAVPVYRSAQFLELPRVTLEVAEACSGVRYLVSTLLLAVPLALITQRTKVRRLFLLFLALVISMAANPVRVTVIGVWAHYTGGDVHGPLHLFHGYAVYLAGMCLLFGGAWMLQRLPERPRLEGVLQAETAGEDRERPRSGHSFAEAWVIAMTILVVAGAALHLHTPEPVPLSKSLDSLPRQFAGWRAMDDGRHYEETGPGQHVLHYANASGRTVVVTITYLESQNEASRLVEPAVHQRLANNHAIRTALPGAPAVPVNAGVFRDRKDEEIRLFWYRVNGRTLADKSEVKWRSALNNLLHRRNNGGLVVLSSNAAPGDREQVLRDLDDLAGKLLPVLNEYMP